VLITLKGSLISFKVDSTDQTRILGTDHAFLRIRFMPFARLLVTIGVSMETLRSMLLEDTDTRIIQKEL
jgi:hypothetical protein